MRTFRNDDARNLLRDSMNRVVATDATLSDWAGAYAKDHEDRLLYDLELVGSLARPDDEIVDLGSSPPFLALALHESGYAVTGVDIDPARFTLNTSTPPPNIHKVDIERASLPFEPDAFDVALFNEVIEHLRIDLIFTLREVHRVLKPGGVLLLSTPNHRSLNGLRKLIFSGQGCHAAGSVYDEYDKLRKYGHMGHVREYTASELSDFLKRVGFTIDRVLYRQHEAGTKRRRVNVFGWAERLLCRMMPGLRRMFTIVCRKPPVG